MRTMRLMKLTNLMICGIALFLFSATYVAFQEPKKGKAKSQTTEASFRERIDNIVKERSVKTKDVSPQHVGNEDTLLLPFAKQAPPRHLLQVPSYMRMINASKKGIDVDISWGDVDLGDLDQQTVIVTGLSQYTEEEGVGLVASAQIHMPFKKIIIYDLGLQKRTLQRLLPLCNVEVRKFNFTLYPAHVRILRNNAWKLIVITETLEEFGSVFYAHPHLRFRAPINILFPFIKQMHGVIPSMTDDYSLLQATHATMLRHMQVSTTKLSKSKSKGPIASGDMLLFVMNSTLFNEAIPNLRKCFLKAKCISPPGSVWRLKKPSKKLHLHHFDLSALSTMMYKTYNENWSPSDDVRRLMKRLYVVLDEGDPIHELPWSFRCNPPKEEFDPAKMLQKKL
ncbi:uncharacterized protein [Asterias amurensis]|uniref:uncharacterized protein isoform X1 n=2 Tax=Asterias amurensis TaxID=7602 RepID=UPI003AB4FFCD